jgi:hypothetical protein
MLVDDGMDHNDGTNGDGPASIGVPRDILFLGPKKYLLR